MLWLTVWFEGGLLVFALGLGVLTGERFWESVEVDFRTAGISLALTAPLLAVMGIGVYSSLRIFSRIRADIDRIVPLFAQCTVLDLLVIGALAGICEEALFRGVLQPFLAGYIGPAPALVLVAVLFGAVHPVSRAYIVFAFIIGIYFGAVQLWFDNVFIPMAIHGLYDFVALVFLSRVYGPRGASANADRSGDVSVDDAD